MTENHMTKPSTCTLQNNYLLLLSRGSVGIKKDITNVFNFLSKASKFYFNVGISNGEMLEEAYSKPNETSMMELFCKNS